MIAVVFCRSAHSGNKQLNGKWMGGNSTMSKKSWLISLILVTAFTVAACASNESASDSGAEPDEAETGSAEAFDWKMADGTTIEVAFNQHPYADAIIEKLDEFKELTGITVDYSVTPEENYFDVVTTALNAKNGKPDVFMTGSYQLWEYAPAGYIQGLDEFLNDPSKTSPDYDASDFLEGVIQSNRWDLTPGNPAGEGELWAIPIGFETNVLAYNKRAFEENDLEVPTTFEELIETAEKLQGWNGPGSYGIATRGTRSWATIHPGYMTAYSMHGAKDFDVEDGKLVAQVNSPEAIEVTDMFAELVKRGGPQDWASYTWYEVSSDLGAGKAAMAFDASSASYFQSVEGASQEGENLAWAPPPLTKDGAEPGANLWIWSLAMNETSEKKDAAWLFMQYFSGKEHTLWGATEASVFDPVRSSVWEDPAFKEKIAQKDGYKETFDAIIDNTSIKFTPQPEFFNTTTEWAGALQDIITSGADTEERMNQLAEDLNERVSRIRR